VKPITYFFPIEEVNNCFQVINQGVDKFQISKNTTGSLETTWAYFKLSPVGGDSNRGSSPWAASPPPTIGRLYDNLKCT